MLLEFLTREHEVDDCMASPEEVQHRTLRPEQHRELRGEAGNTLLRVVAVAIGVHDDANEVEVTSMPRVQLVDDWMVLQQIRRLANTCDACERVDEGPVEEFVWMDQRR